MPMGNLGRKKAEMAGERWKILQNFTNSGSKTKNCRWVSTVEDGSYCPPVGKTSTAFIDLDLDLDRIKIERGRRLVESGWWSHTATSG